MWFIYLAALSRPTTIRVYLMLLLLVLLMQAQNPWELGNSLYPIIVALGFMITRWTLVAIASALRLQRRFKANAYWDFCSPLVTANPNIRFDKRQALKSGGLLFVALFFFSRGLDENKDPYRYLNITSNVIRFY